AFRTRHRDVRVGPRCVDGQDRQGEYEERRRNVTPPARSFTDGFANERKVRLSERIAVAPPLREHVEHGEPGDDDEQQESRWPDEVHADAPIAARRPARRLRAYANLTIARTRSSS